MKIIDAIRKKFNPTLLQRVDKDGNRWYYAGREDRLQVEFASGNKWFYPRDNK